MPYLLDTNVCVVYVRGRNALLMQRVLARPSAELHVCSIVKAELIYGTLRSAQPAVNRATVDAFIKRFVSLPFNDAEAEVQARLRFHLESLGTPIGPYDLQIAAIALIHKLTLVTHNVAEFSRVPGLTVEDWEIP
jgi:tRNA(fMet)-specific endonuclease VapC